MRFLLPLTTLLLAACSGSTPANNQTSSGPEAVVNQAAPAATPLATATFLPTPGTHPARAIAMTVPPEAEALAARMTAAIRANFAWYRAYAAQYPQGELPWHPNLGISEAEYARFLTLTGQIALREIGRVTLTATRRPDGGLALAADGAAGPLNGIILYPERNQVETPLGRLGNGGATANRQARSPTGPWEGVRWTSAGSGATHRVALAFGRRAQGDMLVFYDYGPSDAETVILLYPAAGPPAPTAR
jgi:hypothetical protein